MRRMMKLTSMTRLIAVTLLTIFLCCACASQSGPPSVIYPDPVDVPLDERGVTR